MSQIKDKFLRWLDGDTDVMSHVMDSTRTPDLSRQSIKERNKARRQEFAGRSRTKDVIRAETKGFYAIYNVIAVISCIALISVLLFTVANIPQYGQENPRTVEVVSRYVEHGLEETGAVNIVAGMILDYRAFDTLGEAHVLFTALICVLILLRIDAKNMRTDFENYYTIREDAYFDVSKDSIMNKVGFVILPSIFLFGLYVLLNGQNGPGGGFSGGAIMGAALILFSTSYGFQTTDRFFTLKASILITFVSLTFYCFAKGYVFFMGANGLENGIPKGIPGAILSGGLILPLDIAVGMVVACTMYGFYSLFKRGTIGGA